MDTQSQLQAVGTKLREPGEVRRITVKLTPDAYDSVRETADALELSNGHPHKNAALQCATDCHHNPDK